MGYNWTLPPQIVTSQPPTVLPPIVSNPTPLPNHFPQPNNLQHHKALPSLRPPAADLYNTPSSEHSWSNNNNYRNICNNDNRIPDNHVSRPPSALLPKVQQPQLSTTPSSDGMIVYDNFALPPDHSLNPHPPSVPVSVDTNRSLRPVSMPPVITAIAPPHQMPNLPSSSIPISTAYSTAQVHHSHPLQHAPQHTVTSNADSYNLAAASSAPLPAEPPLRSGMSSVQQHSAPLARNFHRPQPSNCNSLPLSQPIHPQSPLSHLPLIDPLYSSSNIHSIHNRDTFRKKDEVFLVQHHDSTHHSNTVSASRQVSPSSPQHHQQQVQRQNQQRQQQHQQPAFSNLAQGPQCKNYTPDGFVTDDPSRHGNGSRVDSFQNITDCMTPRFSAIEGTFPVKQQLQGSDVASIHIQAGYQDERMHARPMRQQHIGGSGPASPNTPATSVTHPFTPTPSSPDNAGGHSSNSAIGGGHTSIVGLHHQYQHQTPRHTQSQSHLHKRRPLSQGQHHHEQSQPNNLQQEELQKEHPCTYPGCYKAFDRRYNLSVHYRRHTNSMPYSCKVAGCTLRFKWRSSQSHHMKTRHQGAIISTGRGANKRTVVLGAPNITKLNENPRLPPAPRQSLPSLHIVNSTSNGYAYPNVSGAMGSGCNGGLGVASGAGPSSGIFSTGRMYDSAYNSRVQTVRYSNNNNNPGGIGHLAMTGGTDSMNGGIHGNNSSSVALMNNRHATIALSDATSDRGSAEAVAHEEDTGGMAVGGHDESMGRAPFRRTFSQKRQRCLPIHEGTIR